MNSSISQSVSVPAPLDLDRTASICCRIIVPALLVLVLFNGYRDICTQPGGDLRNRVVGARAMLAGYDPYTFEWQPGMPEELLDPIYEPKAHRLTISPPTLLLYAPLAPLPYFVQRVVYFACEWLALLASLALLSSILQDARQRIALMLGATLFVISTDIWRLHVERGQIYVFQLLALSAAMVWSKRGEKDSLAAGIALGVLVLMRPNLLVLAPALLLLRQWRCSGAMLTTVAAGVAATFLILPASAWPSYLAVGDAYYRAVDDPWPGPDDRAPPDHAGTVEGLEFGPILPNISCSSFAQLYFVLRMRHGLPVLDPIVTNKILLLALASLLLVLVWRRRGDVPGAFALAIVLALDTDFFLPHRWGYVDVMLLAPLALLLPVIFRADPPHRLAIGVVAAGILSGVFGNAFFDVHTVTVLRSWLVMGGLTALAIAAPSEQRVGTTETQRHREMPEH